MSRQILAFVLAFIGFMGTIVICALPMWKVTAFVGANIVTAQVFWEGLWMNCVIQSTGHMQCKAYDSLLALPQNLQASRALICVSIGVSVLAIGLTVVGARCTNFLHDDWLAKSKVGIAAGAVFMAAGVLCVIPVSWSAHTIIQGFYNPLATQERRGELGASIYVGWVSGALLMIGGGMLCSTYRCWFKGLTQLSDDTHRCLTMSHSSDDHIHIKHTSLDRKWLVSQHALLQILVEARLIGQFQHAWSTTKKCLKPVFFSCDATVPVPQAKSRTIAVSRSPWKQDRNFAGTTRPIKVQKCMILIIVACPGVVEVDCIPTFAILLADRRESVTSSNVLVEAAIPHPSQSSDCPIHQEGYEHGRTLFRACGWPRRRGIVLEVDGRLFTLLQETFKRCGPFEYFSHNSTQGLSMPQV